MTEKPTIAVAGATGFLGSAMAESMSADFDLIGLTRGSRSTQPHYAEVRQVDLMSRKAASESLIGADYAVYLVHSMMPSARLVQASFRDLDVLCADNFARAAAERGARSARAPR